MLTSLHLNTIGYEYQYGKLPDEGHIEHQTCLLLRDHTSDHLASSVIWNRIAWTVADYTEGPLQHELLEALGAY